MANLILSPFQCRRRERKLKNPVQMRKMGLEVEMSHQSISSHPVIMERHRKPGPLRGAFFLLITISSPTVITSSDGFK